MSAEYLHDAKKRVAKACHWIKNNPDKWQALRSFCKELVVTGDPIQRGSVYEMARSRGMDIRLASLFKRDHNLWSVLSRYLVMERPELMRSLRFRQTPIDKVNLAAYWADIVGDAHFQASSLAQAKSAFLQAETSR